MGNYYGKPNVEEKKVEKLFDVFVKVNGGEYEYRFEYGKIIEPYSGACSHSANGKCEYGNEMDAVMKILENLYTYPIQFDEIFIHCCKTTIIQISTLLYQQHDSQLLQLLNSRNVRFVEKKK